MPNKKVSELSELDEAPSNDDVLIINDVSDDTGSAAGTTKNITVSNLLSGVSSGGGGGGIFITNITCGDNADKDNGITVLVKATSETAVDGDLPVSSATIDTPTTRIYVQWEGDSNNWTGVPYINSTAVTGITSIGGGYARRFEGYADLDLTSSRGETASVSYSYGDLSKSINIAVAGLGPEVQSVTITSNPSHGQDHYKDGDDITLDIVFDTSDVAKILFTGGNDYATNTINSSSSLATDFSMDNATNTATITVPVGTTLTTKTDVPFQITAENTLGTAGETFTSNTTKASVMSGPQIVSATVGSYPFINSTQVTELKNGVQVPITFTFDTNNVNRIVFSGDSTKASGSQTVNSVSTSNKQATVNMTIQGTTVDADTASDLGFQAAARHSTTHGQNGPTFDSGSTTVKVNNRAPSIANAVISYPGTQQALKGNETATVQMEVTNAGSNPSYQYSDPLQGSSQLNIQGGETTYSASKTVQRSSGGYNVSVANYQLVVTRTENGASTTKQAIVQIADTAPTLTVSSNNGARMRSGGNDGTSQQYYNIVISTGGQRLLQAPTLGVPHGTLGPFNHSATATTFTASMGVHDDNSKGNHTYSSINAVNLAGKTVSSITSGSTYTFGGFVSRTLDLSAQTNEVEMNVLHTTYSKVTISWSANSSVTARKPIDTTTQTTNAWCLASTNATPVTVRILDFSKTNATTVDSTITVEESV